MQVWKTLLSSSANEVPIEATAFSAVVSYELMVDARQRQISAARTKSMMLLVRLSIQCAVDD